MAFQDFDQVQERRKAERQRKLQKRLVIGSVAVVLLVAIFIAAFCVLSPTTTNQQPKVEKGGKNHNTNNNKSHPTTDASNNAVSNNAVSRTHKVVDTVCNGTMYKDSCQKTLLNGMKNETSASPNEPKIILKTMISAVGDEIDIAFNKTLKFNFESQREKDAIEDCKDLIDDAREELQKSVEKVNVTDVSSMGKISAELNNWLSAVMSYQTTCVDGFPEGKLKTDVGKALNSSQGLTSNSLAVVKGFSSYIDLMLKGLGGKRQLLDNDDAPSWMKAEERRMLKQVNVSDLHPNVTVAQDGSGNFSSISEALKAMPKEYRGRYVIYVKRGVYDETVTVEKKMENVTMIGDGSQKTIVTGKKSFADKVQTFKTATFVALGNGFMAQSMGFRNTAGPEGHQAVAIRVQSDRSVFLNCRFEGYQDTLYAQTHRQFYRSCVILGTIDFIFGDAAAIFQNCMIFIRKGMSGQQNTVTAHGRTDPFETTGIVLQKCSITADEKLSSAKKEVKSYLGRPWKMYSRTIVMESEIDDVIDPAGWLKWQNTDFAIDTLSYAEYNNEGAGSSTESRVSWPGFKVIKKEEAIKFTVGPFLQGEWINATDTPVQMGLFKS